MSYEDDRTRQVRLGQAINLGWQYALFSQAITSPEDAAALAQEVVPIALSLIEAVQDGAVNTVEEVQKAFPGSTVEHVAEVLPFRNPAPAAPQPAPVPGATHKDDAKWEEYFRDPTAWWDNRNSKKSPNAADFAHKQRKTAKGYPEGLWLSSPYSGTAPSWVFERLGIAQ